MRKAILLCLVSMLGLITTWSNGGCGSGGGGSPPATTPPSTNANLASIGCSAGSLSPAFDAGTLAYAVGPAGLLGVGSVTVTPTADDAGATITVDGTPVASGTASPAIPLPLGSTPVAIVVTAADGTTTNAYAVVFSRVGPTAQQAYLKASNTDDWGAFGYSVSVAGDTLVVGARGEASGATGVNGDETDSGSPEAGAAYVFTLSGTVWSQQAYLKASDTNAGDFFGWSVAASGDTIVVGAPLEDSDATGVNGDDTNNGASASGAAYVFTRTGTVWSQQAYLKASNTGAGDQFGFSVAIDGETIVVGANMEASNATGVNGDDTNNSSAGSGAAYVFTRTGTSWSQQAYLKASNTDDWDQFGWSVAVAGDTLVVGATGEASNATGVNGDDTNNGAPESGAAYVFIRTGTSWSQQAYVKASNTEAWDEFGYGVALDGDTLVVGARYEDSSATGVGGNESDNSADNSGAAYVFTRTGAAWSQQAYLKASNTDAGDRFGASVALDGDALVVGAIYEMSTSTGVNGDDSDNSGDSNGAAYVFTRTGTTWSQSAYLKASNADLWDEYGSSVGLSGDSIVVGAPFEDSNATGVGGDQSDNSSNNSGAVYCIN